MEQAMSGIQPQILTNEELVKYAWLQGADKLDPAWVQELLKRLEATLDDNK
jgi:hypothetical protein